MKFYSKSLFLICLIFVILYSCQKESQSTSNNNYTSYKKYIYNNAGSYSNETIAVKTENGTILTGSLNWDKLTQIFYEGEKYVYIPFYFKIAGNQYAIIPSDSINKIPGVSFFLVLKNKGSSNYDVALSTRLNSIELTGKFLNSKGTIENYYSVNGEWKNSWFYDYNNNTYQRIYKSSEVHNRSDLKGSSNPVTNYVPPPCEVVAVTTYETNCWSTGGPNNETACQSVPTTTYYTFCDDSGDGGGGSGGGGGSYPPTGGSTVDEISYNTKTPVESNLKFDPYQIRFDIHLYAENGKFVSISSPGVVVAQPANQTNITASGTKRNLSVSTASLTYHVSALPASTVTISWKCLVTEIYTTTTSSGKVTTKTDQYWESGLKTFIAP